MIPFMFAAKFAFKSIARRPKKNMGTILAVALGVTLLIGVQVGSVALEQTLADNWYRTIDENDLAVYDISSPIFPANVTQLIEDANLAGLELITERLDLPSVFYFEKDGQLVKNVDLQGLVPEHQDQLGGFYSVSGEKLDASLLEQNNSIFINN